MVEPILIVVGGAIAAAGAAGGGLVSEPGFIDAGLSEGQVKNELDKIILEKAKAIIDATESIEMQSSILSLLDPKKMSQKNQATVSAMQTNIAKRQGDIALQQGEMAMGKKIDEQVSRGAMSQEEGERQKAKNTAAIQAVANIWKKKSDAQAIGLARILNLRSKRSGMSGAQILASQQSNLRNLFNTTVGNQLGHYLKRAGSSVGLQAAAQEANLRMGISTADTMQKFHMGLMMLQGGAAGDIYSQGKQQSDYEQGLEKYYQDLNQQKIQNQYAQWPY